MTKYATEVKDIFTLLDADQTKAFVESLKSDEIRVIRAEILPNVNLTKRLALKELLNERERALKQNPETVPPHLSITQQLQNIYEKYTSDIVSKLSAEARKVFLANATKDQLALLHKKLSNQPESALTQALIEEIGNRKRTAPDTVPNLGEVGPNLQTEFTQWQAINTQINKANLSVIPKVAPTEPEKPAEVKPDGWFTRLLRAVGLISTPAPQSVAPPKPKPVIQEQPSVPLDNPVPVLDEEGKKRKARLEALEQAGQLQLDAVTKESSQKAPPQVKADQPQLAVDIPKVSKRTQKDIDTAIQSRFGMVLAAQMVAGTRNGNHKQMEHVIDSIAYESDSDSTLTTINAALSANKSTLSHEHMFKSGGQPLYVTVLERDIFADLVGPNTHGVKLTDEERENIRRYHENIERSMKLTAVTQPLQSNAGGYEKVKTGERAAIGKGEYRKLDTPEALQKQADFEKDLSIASELLQNKCKGLKDGEAVYFDTGLEGHAMQLVIKREGDQFKLTTYDSSGALERTDSTKGFSPWGLFKTAQMGQERMRKNAFSFSIPQEKLLTPQGQDYLSYLIRTKTTAGWAEVSIEKKATFQPNAVVHFLARFFDYFKKVEGLQERAKKYAHYMDKFTSIASPDSPAYFEDMLQRPQNTMNCFAKKAQACELYELGRPTYKKVRSAILQEQKARLIDDACLEIPVGEDGKTVQYLPAQYQKMIKSIVPQYLSPSELHAASTRLAEISSPPSPETYQKYFTDLRSTLKLLTNVDLIQENEVGLPKENQELLQENIGEQEKIDKLLKETATHRLTEKVKVERLEKENGVLLKQNEALLQKNIELEKLNATALPSEIEKNNQIRDENLIKIGQNTQKILDNSKEIDPFKEQIDKHLQKIESNKGKIEKNNAKIEQNIKAIPLNAKAEPLARPRINDKLKQHLEEFVAHFAADGRTDAIESYFKAGLGEPTINFPGKGKVGFDWDNKTAMKELTEFAAAQTWKASVQLLNHQIQKVGVAERCINSASERRESASFSEAKGLVRVEDLANANIVNFTTGWFRKDETKIEIMLGGKPRELDKATFFKLVVANKESLTDPKVMSLLDYVRNISPEMEKRYTKEVYGAQRQAFIDKIEQRIFETVEARRELGVKFSEQEQELKALLQPFAAKKEALTQAITEAEKLAEGKETLLLKNLKLQLKILGEEEIEVQTYLTDLKSKYNALDHEANNTITQCVRSLEQLRSSGEKHLTINEVSTIFTQTNNQLVAQEKSIAQRLHHMDVTYVEEAVNQRIKNIHENRAEFVKSYLQANPEYRILDDLAAGKMGTEKHRRPEMYDAFKPPKKEDERRKGFAQGSVFQEIQSLNQKLKAQMQEIANRDILLKVGVSDESSLASLGSRDATYAALNAEAGKLTTQPLPAELKKEWVKEMFGIWLKHQSPDDLFKLQTKYKDNLAVGVNQAFHQFLEQKANIKYGALKEAHYPVELTQEQLPEMGWKEVLETDVTAHLAKLQTAAQTILKNFRKLGKEGFAPSLEPGDKFKRAAQILLNPQLAPKVVKAEPVTPPVTLKGSDLRVVHNPGLKATAYVAPSDRYLTQEARQVFEGSTLKFLRDNPKPSFSGLAKDLSHEQCQEYFIGVQNYLTKLDTNPGLENRAERIEEFCLSEASKLFSLPEPPPKKLANAISEILLKPYRLIDPETKAVSLAQGFKQLENNERQQLLTSLMKLQLSQLSEGPVNDVFYSAIKHWERLIIPKDKAMSAKIATLTGGGTEPIDMTVIKEVNQAITESPISLEALHEGQLGLQKALAAYEDPKLRELADRLYMRNGDVLLAQQFIAYYEKRDNVISNSTGLNSTEGREFFLRAALDALQHASAPDKIALIKSIAKLKTFAPNDGEPTPEFASSYKVFIDEVLFKCANLDPVACKQALGPAKFIPTDIEEYITTSLADDKQDKGTQRLFVFAKEINLLALKIEQEQLNKPVNQGNLDVLYSKLICSNLAYQLLIDQLTEEARESIEHNFEYNKEMSSVQANLSKLENNLVSFTQNIGSSSPFKRIWDEYADGKRFDGSKLKDVTVSRFDIPGFISLGGKNSIDVLHGAVYIGNNKMGVMPAYIQNHIALQELKIADLPFRKVGKAFVYSEQTERGFEEKASITLDGDKLIIQRELPTLGTADAEGTPQKLQYVSPSSMNSIPKSLKRRLNAEHFFLDSENVIHAFTADFKPIMTISGREGLFLDHNGNKMPINLDASNASAAIKKLAGIFPQDEMINVGKNSVYIPALAKYATYNEDTKEYFLADKLSDVSGRRILEITKEGNALTKKELTPAEVSEIADLDKKIAKLNINLREITKGDLVSLQQAQQISKQIKSAEAQIEAIKNAEHFIFVPDSDKIVKLEAGLVKLRTAMESAYDNYRKGVGNKEQLAKDYDDRKREFFVGKRELAQAYATTSMLRTFDVKNGSIQPKDIESILHVGMLPGKTQVFTKLLGANIPQVALKSNELIDLRARKDELQKKAATKTGLNRDEKLALIMLMGVELNHHIKERTACATGKIRQWEEPAYTDLKEEFAKEVGKFTSITEEEIQRGVAPDTIPLENFSELWRSLKSEFPGSPLTKAFTKPVVSVETGEKKPISINTKTTNMPIESIGARALVQFTPHKDPHNLVDDAQHDLEVRLQKLKDPSVDAQEEGYYYENYGLFTQSTLNKLFSIKENGRGIEGLSANHVAKLIQLMKDENWIVPLPPKEGASPDAPVQYQLTRHPSEFFSSPKLASFLTDAGFKSSEINTISERTETFLYQTAVNGGDYSVSASDKKDIVQRLLEAKNNCNLESVLALDKINSILENASPKVSMAELNAAYLLNDYSKILASFSSMSAKDRAQAEIALNNGVTRLLYYKTELDHLTDIEDTFNRGQDSKALCMLHIRRNYSLDKLLDSEIPELNATTTMEKVNQERKMQRAFLLFESEFGHRCNARQVNIFRGLLLDDRTNPDKIDSAQARMGFGKTTLLPLVALYKTGDKLVRFIVPKSALETNTSDMSTTLTNILGGRAVKDDFQRYRMVPDDEKFIGDQSLLLKSLKDANADLHRRLDLYKSIRDNREVLVQSPNVRNAMECQLQIFLDMLSSTESPVKDPKQRAELMQCISVLNEIRSLTTVSIFDELDATQDSATTDVNYTTGKKEVFPEKEIYPLELISQAILEVPLEKRTEKDLPAILLAKFGIKDDDGSIARYMANLKGEGLSEPTSDAFKQNDTAIYLMRAILTDPAMLSIFTAKAPGSDYGVYFENMSDGSKTYDYGALKSEKNNRDIPLLICVPYAAANTPKPKGSRFDSAEVTAITTLLYYNDPRTDVQEIPHLEFLIDSFVNDMSPSVFYDGKGELPAKYHELFAAINKVAEVSDPMLRAAKRKELFAAINSDPSTQKVFREMLARAIVHEQIKTDPKKANSNRYEQGTIHDEVIGFSGTAGDTSSHFRENMLDPAADGNMTLGIMGRDTCQSTIDLDTLSIANKGKAYTPALLAQLVNSFSENTRTLIDVGGLCKLSNRAVAQEIALQLQAKGSPLKGVIFYDDVTNMKKLLTVDPSTKKETIVDLTADMVAESDKKGSYFTYYDQSHSRGADIKQMDKAHAVLTVFFTVTNNDYKQAIMRMRKIVDKAAGQSFSIAVPDVVKKEIIKDLDLASDATLTGNDIAFWLRKKELKNNLSNVSVLIAEVNSVIKNAVLQQQAALTEDLKVILAKPGLTAEQKEAKIKEFDRCMDALKTHAKFISGSSADLQEKYGKIFKPQDKAEFIAKTEKDFGLKLIAIFKEVNDTRTNLGITKRASTEAESYYTEMAKKIIAKRGAQLPDKFDMPSSGDADMPANALAEAQSENENQSQSQSESQSESQSMSQTHTFSAVSNEDVLFKAKLLKQTWVREEVSLAYLVATKDLISAHELPGMSNIFKAEDHISTSPFYTKDLTKTPILPPVRYLLARSEGDPKVILINQDEANEFKKGRKAPWTLYDLRSVGDAPAHALKPIEGPAVSLPKAVLDKLNFTALRHEIKGKDTVELATSLAGICTPEQLKPSLHVEFAETRNATKEAAPFKLDKWGFSGKNDTNIYVDISQVRKQHAEGHEERGIAISFGDRGPSPKPDQKPIKIEKGTIVISEILKDRIANEPSLKAAAKAVHVEFEIAKKERAAVRELLHAYEKDKAKIMEESHSSTPKIDPDAKAVLNKDGSQALTGEIVNAELLKANLIRKREQAVLEAYRESMKAVMDTRKGMKDLFKNNLVAMASVGLVTEPGYGIPIKHKDFNGQFKMAAKSVDPNNMFAKALEILKAADERGEIPNEEALKKKLNEIVKTMADAVSDRYNHFTKYKAQKETLIEFLHKESNNKGKAVNSSLGESLENAVGYRMKVYFDDLDKDLSEGLHATIAKALESAKGKNLSLEAFHNHLQGAITDHIKANEKDFKEQLVEKKKRAYFSSPEAYTTQLMTSLGVSFPDKESTYRMMSQIIVENLKDRVGTKTDANRDLYSRLEPMLEKIKLPDFDLPEIFKNPPARAVPPDELRAALVESLLKQNIRVTPQITDQIMKKWSDHLEGQQWLQQNLSQDPVVKTRDLKKKVVDAVTGEERVVEVQISKKVKTVLTELDEQIHEAQQGLDRAIEEKARKLRELEDNYKPPKLAETCRNNAKLTKDTELLGKLITEHGNVHRAVPEVNRKYNVIQTEWTAFKKLLIKLLDIVPFFKKNEINVEKSEVDPEHPIYDYMGKRGKDKQYTQEQLAGLDFVDSHFDLSAIMENEVSTSAELSFAPPEFYEVEKDINIQESRMHHHDERDPIEHTARTSLDNAVTTVRGEAGKLMARTYSSELQLAPVVEEVSTVVKDVDDELDDGLVIDEGYASDDLEDPSRPSSRASIATTVVDDPDEEEVSQFSADEDEGLTDTEDLDSEESLGNDKAHLSPNKQPIHLDDARKTSSAFRKLSQAVREVPEEEPTNRMTH